MTTLRDLARELGVSAMAVSMALRNHPRVSMELRARAQALAQARGYVPNPAWSRRSARRRRFGEPLMPAALLTQLNPIWPYPPMNFIEALTRSAREMGYRLTVYQQDGTISPERMQRVLWQTGVEALLIGPVFDARIFDVLPWPQFSVLAVGSGHFMPPCHWVTLDVGRALCEILDRCLERGYRRMALVDYREPQGPADAFDRMGAIGWARHRARTEGWAFEVFETLPSREPAVLDALRAFSPDAIIGQTPSIWFAQREWKWAIQRRVGFVAWRLDPQSLRYGLCGFSEDVTPLAAYAIRFLDAEVRAFQRGLPQVPVKQLVPMRWVEGDSLPARRRTGGAFRREITPTLSGEG